MIQLIYIIHYILGLWLKASRFEKYIYYALNESIINMIILYYYIHLILSSIHI